MKRVIKMLNRSQFGFLSTLENGEPRVRPFQFQFEADGKIYFCTSEEKSVSRQLKEFPYAEFGTYDKAFNFIRIRGSIKLSEELELKEHIMKINPYYREKFGSKGGSVMVLFYFHHGTATVGRFDQYPPEIFEF